MATPQALQAQLAQARSPEEYVDMLQHGVQHFPRTALFWRLYAEHERGSKGPGAGLEILESGGAGALPWCRVDPELWRVYCEATRDVGRREDELGEASEALGRRFERAVSVAGCAPDSAPLWRCYVDWASNAAPVALRKGLRRSALERACLVPGEGLEETYRLLDSDARDGSDRDLKDFCKFLEPHASAARKDGHARTQLWLSARHGEGDDLGRRRRRGKRRARDVRRPTSNARAPSSLGRLFG